MVLFLLSTQAESLSDPILFMSLASLVLPISLALLSVATQANKRLLMGEAKRQKLQYAIEANERLRQSMAMDLHDHVGQHFSLAAKAFSLVPKQQLQGVYLHDFEFAEKLLLNSIRDLKQVCRAIDGKRQLADGLGPVLRHDLEQLEAHFHIGQHFASSLPEGSPYEESHFVLYRIFQELSHNTLKHAHAGHIGVALAVEGSALRFDYADDGRGFAPDEAARKRGFGMQHLEQRVASIGGTLDFRTAPGQGVQVSIRVPFGKTKQ